MAETHVLDGFMASEFKTGHCQSRIVLAAAPLTRARCAPHDRSRRPHQTLRRRHRGQWAELRRAAEVIAGHDLRDDTLAAKQQLAFFPDEPRLFDYLTVRQHLEFTARLYQVRDAADRSRELLDTLELTDKASSLPTELSRGMKQKVALACGFLHAPRAMFFDEPLTGLDPLAIRRTKDLIVRKAREGVAIIISSHLLHLLEEVCSHVLILKRGKKIAHGTLEEIRTQHREGEKEATLEEIFIRLVGEDAGK